MSSSGTAAVAQLQWDRSKLKNFDLRHPAIKHGPFKAWIKWAVSPPFYVKVGGAPQAVVKRYKDAKFTFEDHARFSSLKRPWVGTEKWAERAWR